MTSNLWAGRLEAENLRERVPLKSFPEGIEQLFVKQSSDELWCGESPMYLRKTDGGRRAMPVFDLPFAASLLSRFRGKKEASGFAPFAFSRQDSGALSAE
jgi:hypothetical protein